MLAGVYPLWTAYGVSIISALIITKIKDPNKAYDAIVAINYAKKNNKLVIISFSGGFTIDIFSFLFGSILLVSVDDTILILALTGAILIVILFSFIINLILI